MTNGRERREAKRISYICEVLCEGSGMRSLTTRINDLSTTGVFIDSMSTYPVGSVIKLKFNVRDVPIEVSGEVRYAMAQVGMGVRFIDLKPEHREAIECMIEGRPTGPLPDISALEAAPPAQQQNVLMGNFAIVSLFDIIQMIDNSRQTGVLMIASPAVNGEIHFNEGQIVGAASEANVSVDALAMFLAVTEGIFTFRKSDKPYPRTIQASSNMALMMDLLRVKDEDGLVVDW
jgi:hypothetical protein